MDLHTALAQLARDPAAPLDLAELSLCLAREEYPDLDVEAYLAEIDGMAHEARRYLRGGLDAQVTGLCRYLFHEMGFRGNEHDYYDPRNSYLNQVLDRRTGIPITLSAVVMGVGSRAGLEVQGVGLPGHFIVKAVRGDRQELFDPFHGGRRLSPEDCETLVRQVTGEPFRATAQALAAVPLGAILLRMLNNLKAVYLGSEDFVRGARVIECLRRLDPSNPLQVRDLGTSLLRAGQFGKAIDHLSAYLKALPEAEDADTVLELLRSARRRVAEWN
jgi:regulator of sirC expression with transglutaminase-like and TPR domain